MKAFQSFCRKIKVIFNVLKQASQNSPPGGGGEYSLIWAVWGRAAGQGMVFWPHCPKQGVQFDLVLS